MSTIDELVLDGACEILLPAVLDRPLKRPSLALRQVRKDRQRRLGARAALLEIERVPLILGELVPGGPFFGGLLLRGVVGPIKVVWARKGRLQRQSSLLRGLRGSGRTSFDAKDGEEERQPGARDRHVPDVVNAERVCFDDEKPLGRRQCHAFMDPSGRRGNRVNLGLSEDASGGERVSESSSVSEGRSTR